MKKSILAFATALLVLTQVSCTKKLEDRLPGTWNVTEVKTEPASGSGSSSTNVGTMSFVGGGTGSYTLMFFGNPLNGNFQWVAADNNATVTLSGFVVNGAYTVLTNKNNKQVWQQLNTNGDKYTYTLER
jgi:hypothetical protein